jgi:molybdate transport repressor ModE-like protein
VDLNLRLLEALTAVAEEGSMTRAAVRLTMTQQAVSGQIRQLERIVGTPLVRRLPSGVELTVAGQAVVKQGRSLITATTAMVDEARRIGSGRSGRLRIVFKAQSTAHFMPEVEAAPCRTASDVQVEPVAMHTLPDEIQALVDGKADAAFLWLPIGNDPRFVIHPLIDEPRWVALPPGHPLATRASPTWPASRSSARATTCRRPWSGSGSSTPGRTAPAPCSARRVAPPRSACTSSPPVTAAGSRQRRPPRTSRIRTWSGCP